MDHAARLVLGGLNPPVCPAHSVAGAVLLSALACFSWSGRAEGGVVLPEPAGFVATGQDPSAHAYRDGGFPFSTCPGLILEPQDSLRGVAREAEDEYLRGKYYASTNNLDTAIVHFSKSIQLDPKIAKVHVARGEVYLARGERQKAIRDFLLAVELSPMFADAHTALGHGHLANKEWQAAVSELTKAIELNPRDYSAFAARGFAYLRLDDRTKALADQEAAVYLLEREREEMLEAFEPSLLGTPPRRTRHLKAQRFDRLSRTSDIDIGMVLGAWQRRRMLEQIYPVIGRTQAEDPLERLGDIMDASADPSRSVPAPNERQRPAALREGERDGQ